MNHVGIVLISHSPEIVKGLESLLKQIQENVPLAVAGGTDDNEIGTDVFKIKQAIESVYSEKGVVILFDLGSALINAEMAIEMLENHPNIKIADAPLVEGAYAAVVEAGIGSTLEEVVAAAEAAKNLQKVH
ncbi:dihydroxyacetone kinase phosphoryl donor subunit DhaM [Bacillus methanolicus]|uniref:phosphoenolpyruvate--glycerone phosphotransferase n=1 Tax=Bacillus methanolicus (strain MGA3 / ATCC 53907) TaxID=796606 RepID=I3E7W6_BACMM|nr:dihydroxyacetone kinase phosphoryl donor subunit DhaM [Bacillus methanolicus]AIE59403.1 dihydroxyacetone kinase, phosphotransfer subunit [Bacillus methanolicus MGA3]EIJ82587.1 dihydroxyacetone kinase, phosphotransfer subunit [Bacillus methanolicus MGA3]